MALRGRFVSGLIRLLRPTLASPGRGYQCSVFAVRGEYTVKPCQVDSRFGYQGCQPGDEVHRLEDHVGGAISVWGFQFIPNLALIRQ